MELLKNTTFISGLWVLLGIVVVVLGVYREHLYREKDSQQQQELVEMQKRMLTEQAMLKQTVHELVRKGKIAEEVAQEILSTVASSQVTVEDEVVMKLSPADKSDSKE